MIRLSALLCARSLFLNKFFVMLICVFPSSILIADDDNTAIKALEQRVQALQKELDNTRAALSKAEQDKKTSEEKLRAISTASEPMKQDDKIRFGNLKVGGAIRANYAIGDYPETGGASRGFDDGGNFALDTFRLNLDYKNGPYLGKLEYRWYNGYNFLHTGWLGYQLDDNQQIQLGVNRVPFGPGAYGISQSWFFDQHYYLGLSDDMDLGIKYSQKIGRWNWDIAYYAADEGTYTGSSKDSARYSYDVVNKSGQGYEERNQFNLRGIVHLVSGDLKTDLGASLQYG
ncbi:hypothetical protein LCGC14_0845960 [marine sediment metagenome]|uniref:Uncharacterized protein n=1 Tax=marine sediment metagenome TaxID=412755 RepID=A0A0F9SIS5_9ZZZZ